ncbi:retention module-containing protein, partial [Caldimonas caldifontis]|uniref:retention module-containing protein n=1 Tax=Caldimonas caldifontis TaxID=1452508 RepID=UPI001473EE1B
MASSPAPIIGTVSTLIGQAFVREANGQMRPLRLGDVIREGDVVVLADGAQLEIQDEAGATYVPREGEALTAAALMPTHDVKAATVVASEDIDRVIASLEPGATGGQDGPAAGLTADAGGDGMTPGLRVERIVEEVGSREPTPPATGLSALAPERLDALAADAVSTVPGNPTTPSDLIPPQVSITPSNPLLSAGESTTVTFEFTEPIAGFGLGGVTVTGGSLSGLTQTGPTTWTAVFTQAGTEQPSITIGAGAYTDLAGNAGGGAHLTLAADTAAPSLTITAADPLLAAGESTTV